MVSFKVETVSEERSFQNRWRPLYSSVKLVDDFPYNTVRKIN